MDNSSMLFPSHKIFLVRTTGSNMEGDWKKKKVQVVSGGANTSAKAVNSKYFNNCMFLIIMTTKG